ncbi:MAG: hypothetical protein ACUVTD_01495 [Nitrososphaerales archaeon]
MDITCSKDLNMLYYTTCSENYMTYDEVRRRYFRKGDPDLPASTLEEYPEVQT